MLSLVNHVYNIKVILVVSVVLIMNELRFPYMGD